MSDAAANQDEKSALDIFAGQVRSAWRAAAGSDPDDNDVLVLLRLAHVAVLDVEEGARDERDGLDLLARSVIVGNQAGAAWSRILQLIADRSQQQSGATEQEIRAALQSAGIVLRAPQRYEEDITRLKRLSEQTIVRLSQQSYISVGGVQVHIKREVVRHLRANLERHSTAVVGVPGAGKSGVLHDMAGDLRSEGRDVICLAVGELAAESLGELRNELGLEHELIDVLSNWSGDKKGFLLIDALDASRGERSERAFLTLMGAVNAIRGRWHIAASVRKYDLRYSRDLQDLFPTTSQEGEQCSFTDLEFPRVCHVSIPLFSDAELAEVRRQIPLFDQILNGAPPDLQQLLRVPFNVRLMANVVDAGGSVAELRPIRTQSELLRQYWSRRVLAQGGGNARERMAKRACDEMVRTRRLRSDRDAVLEAGSSATLDGLLSSGVLVEWQSSESAVPTRQILAFAHHILFDFAASLLYLPQENEDIVSMLTSDPDVLILIRPSLVMRYEALWREGPNRFWDLLFKICSAPGVPSFGKVVGATVLADLATVLEDLRPLTDTLASNDVGLCATAEKLLQYLLSAIATSAASAIGGVEAGPWAKLLAEVTSR